MAEVSDDADLDKLITRIHADLRAGRQPTRRHWLRRRRRSGSTLRVRLRGYGVRMAARIRSSRWLAPVLIFAAVTILVLLFDSH